MPDPIEEHELPTAEAFVAELLPLTGRLWTEWRDGGPSPDWIFRGQRDARWGLQPSAFRADAFASFVAPDIQEPSSERTERHHVMQFAGLADELGFLLPGDSPELRDPRPRSGPILSGGFPPLFPQTELMHMFALAQHYGVPTRLLDWTARPLIAAYFAGEAARSDDDAKLAVWALSRPAIDDGPLGVRTSLDRHPRTFVAFLEAPTATNPNLAAQAGLFTLVHDPRTERTDPVRNIDELVTPEAFGAPSHPVLYKFTLHHRHTPRLLRVLAEHRVHAGTVYPGLHGVAQTLKERARHR